MEINVWYMWLFPLS